MATIAALDITSPQTQIWQTVNRKKQIVTVGHGLHEEMKIVAMYVNTAVKPSDSECHILFPVATGALNEKRGAVADIALKINKVL